MSESMTIAVWLDSDLATAFALLEGVQEFSRQHNGWRVMPLHYTQENVLLRLLREKRLDGLIGEIVSDRWLDAFPRPRIPMVNTGALSAITKIPSVIADNDAIGALACNHLRAQHPAALACLHEPANHAARIRRNAFLRVAKHHHCHVLEPPPHDGFAPNATWREWLATLPAHTALFCTSDPLAQQAIQRALALRLRIPDHLAVLGVGDHLMQSVLASIPLSSIPLPARRIGFRAAETLQQLLLRQPVKRLQRIAPETLLVRESSARPNLSDPFVARAMAYILQHLHLAPDVPALTQSVRISRRALENRFQRTLATTPAFEWRRLQIEEAKRLLTHTRLTLAVIAERTGWSSPHHFANAFKKATSQTPGEFRKG